MCMAFTRRIIMDNDAQENQSTATGIENTLRYSYNGQFWIPCPLMSAGVDNNFFHSAFGVTSGPNQVYLDKHAQFRRMRWATFLTYYKNETMPQQLEDTLMNSLSTIDTYRHISTEDPQFFLTKYISDIIAADRNVTMEEIPILATLENARIVVLFDTEPDSKIIVAPNPDILGGYPVPEVAQPQEIVLLLKGNLFSRLEPASNDSISRFERGRITAREAVKYGSLLSRLEDNFIKYKKGGSAGSKGVQYQVSVIGVVLLNAFKNARGWRLSTENKDAGKFDDIVLESEEGGTFIQCKHKETRRVTLGDLMSTNSISDFSLPKYFLSYLRLEKKFKVKNLIICTNAHIQERALVFLTSNEVSQESLLYQEGNSIAFYTFNDYILPSLRECVLSYYSHNSRIEDIDEREICEDRLKDFLLHLQFYTGYSSISRLKLAINKSLSTVKYCNHSLDKISFLELYPKLMDWYQQVKGVYLNELYAKSLFAEIRTDKFCQRLDQHKVHYFEANFSDFHERILQVSCGDRGLLQTIRIYQTLQNDKTRVLLFVTSEDNMDMQELIIEAFQCPAFTHLIIIWNEGSIPVKTCDDLRCILQRYQYKKIILVGQNDELLQRVGLDIRHENVSVTWENLRSDSQRKLLTKRCIILQGKDLSLRSHLRNQTPAYYNRVIKPDVLEKVVKEEEIRIGSTVQPLHEDIACCYVPRKFTREVEEEGCNGDTKRETFSEEDIFETEDKFVVIENRGGMGKTTALSHLATVLKRQHPHLWIMRIELGEYSSVLREFLKKGKTKISLTELLNSRDATSLKTEFERVTFSVREKVLLLLDGVDEISEEVGPYLKLLIELLKECWEAPNLAKVFVAGREHTIEIIAEELRLVPFKLLPFTREDYVHFFANFWRYNLGLTDSDMDKCRVYSGAVERKMRSWLNRDGTPTESVVVVPRCLKMLAEILQSSGRFDAVGDWDGCEEFLRSDTLQPNLPRKSSIPKLLEMLIEKKGDFLIDGKGSSDHQGGNQTFVKKYKEFLASLKMY